MSEQKINSIKNEALSLILKASGEKELNDLKIKFLGRKSEFNSILKDLKEMPEEQRRIVGALANVAKKEIENTFIEKEKDLKEKSFDFEAEKIDVTIPAKKCAEGIYTFSRKLRMKLKISLLLWGLKWPMVLRLKRNSIILIL